MKSIKLICMQAFLARFVPHFASTISAKDVDLKPLAENCL